MKEIEKLIEKTPLADVWKKIGVKHHHGITVSLMSLISVQGGGVGEFGDLCHMGLLCRKWGLDTLQLLPLNDSGLDPSPYNALSSIALNPIYLNLQSLPAWEAPLKELVKLNADKTVSYEKVYRLKEKLLWDYYIKFYDGYKELADYINFSGNNPWVWEYALFKALKKKHDNKSWRDWPEDLHDVGETKLEELADENMLEMRFYVFVQYLCYKQLTATKNYLKSQGILLMGDLPILLSPDSVDVWLHRDHFDLAFSAGSPPDIFNDEGQNWGFPIYNWKKFSETEYAWWRRRLAYASHFYDMYRIDHVLGFFHLWIIPRGKEAKDGHYHPPQGDIGIEHGKRLLKTLIESSTMLPVAEDLGLIPDGLTECLHAYGIPGTRVPRWERNWETDKSYIPYEDYYPINMTSVSTHDSETLGEWWVNRKDEAAAYAKFQGWSYDQKPLSKEHQLQMLKDAHSAPTLLHCSPLQEHLRLFDELSWGKPEDERINIPGHVLPTNWVYRYKPMVDLMIDHKGLENHFLSLI